ncbi:hypothetical protein BYT27DRAFT_7169993 [Phlegmacium glaucopus]|nr:hypothetical protein BYT27DRAFT_7169993 [Phlegmacium glaucopus]
MHAPAYTPFPQRARSFTPSDAPQASTTTHLPSPANTITSSHLRELARHQLSHREVVPDPPYNSASSRPLGSHPAISPDLLAAIASALGSTASPYIPNPETSQPVQKFFSRTITNTTSKLPIAVIKELRSGFKNYIPLTLCTHKACSNATRSSDAFDTEIGMNERGEIRLKQKTLTASKDYTISTDDFTEIRENFTCGLKKYLIFGEDVEPGGERALACAGMFSDFFSVIASRPDYTQDWPSYRGYIIEQYTSWIGRRDDSFGLIFDEHLFHKYKMKVLVPSILEQLRQPSMSNITSSIGSRGFPNSTGGGISHPRGRGRGASGGSFSNHHRAGSTQSFLGHSQSTTFKCYLCGDAHSHREHHGPAKRLITNEHRKWVDRALGNRIVCISFNVASAGCRRPSCSFSHSCSLCGDPNHGSARCSN